MALFWGRCYQTRTNKPLVEKLGNLAVVDHSVVNIVIAGVSTARELEAGQAKLVEFGAGVLFELKIQGTSRGVQSSQLRVMCYGHSGKFELET